MRGPPDAAAEQLHHPAGGVGAVQGRPRPLDHLDTVEAVHRDLAEVDAAQRRGGPRHVEAHPVEEDEGLARGGAAQAEAGHQAGGAAAGKVDSRKGAQQVGCRLRAGGPGTDVEDVGGERGTEDRGRRPGSGDDDRVEAARGRDEREQQLLRPVPGGLDHLLGGGEADVGDVDPVGAGSHLRKQEGAGLVGGRVERGSREDDVGAGQRFAFAGDNPPGYRCGCGCGRERRRRSSNPKRRIFDNRTGHLELPGEVLQGGSQVSSSRPALVK